MGNSARGLFVGLVVVLSASFAFGQSRPARPATAPAARPAATPPAGAANVLDLLSVWRIHQTLKPPVILFDDGPRPLTCQYEWLDRETEAAPEGWAKPEFCDANWLRGGARAATRTPYLANLCLRARFEVTDPTMVKDLKVSVAYYGGAIVSINGQELARGQLPKDARGPDALAEGYTAAAFLTDKGELIPRTEGGAQYKAAMEERERKLTDVAIPAAALRKGVNVLAIEIIRAPYHKTLDEHRSKVAIEDKLSDRLCPYEYNWNTCEIRQVRLTAASAEGLIPNASRPKELQAWNSDLLTPDWDSDFGDRCEELRPVDLRGPRNGWLSGKVVVGCANAIENLQVTCGDLEWVPAFAGQRRKVVIPASKIRIRYAVPFGNTSSNGDDHSRDAAVLDSLLETPLDSFPAGPRGVAVPIWITAKASAGIPGGVYTGQATIEAKGQKALTVLIRAEIADFAVPDTQDYRTWIEVMQSPDTLAKEYKVPPWSDKHWDLIAQSMRYIGEIGSRVVHVPLIAQTNSGNEQSMVRFIKKADGTYDYDFTLVDKYLDAAEKNMGKPKIVAFIAWEIYLATPKNEVKVDPNEGGYVTMEKSWLAARWELRGKGPFVTTFDPTTKEIGTINLPRFDDPAAKPIWKPLFDELHKRMAKRGLEKTMCLGMASDQWGNKEEMATLQEVSGNLPWINQTHGGSHVGSKLAGVSPVAYTAFVWNVRYAQDPNKGRTYGWKRPELYAEFRRGGALNDWPLATIHLFPELQITGQQRGVGRIGGDFWPVLLDKQGRRRGWIWAPYLQSMWHSCQLSSHLLTPGLTGPVASTRYEIMREGIQECEARITIEQALLDESARAKLGPDLAAKCQRFLDDRTLRILKAFNALQLSYRVYATSKNTWGYSAGGTAGHYWYVSDGWRDRSQTLYDLAGEVTKKLAEK